MGDVGLRVVLKHLSGAHKALALIAAVLCALLIVAGVWRGTGGRWMTIESASMGEAAPVGTLVLTRPTTTGALHAGDIVSFRTKGGATYTHRVVRVKHGVVQTKGDVNGTVDPYRTADDDLVGKVVARWWPIGFVLRALPYLLVLSVLGWLLTGRLRRGPVRTALRVLGASLLVAGIVVIQHPLVGLQVASARHSAGVTTANVVSTGIFPISVHAAGGTDANLSAGELATVKGKDLDAHARLPLHAAPYLRGWWLVAVILVCAAPFIAALWLGRKARVGGGASV